MVGLYGLNLSCDDERRKGRSVVACGRVTERWKAASEQPTHGSHSSSIQPSEGQDLFRSRLLSVESEGTRERSCGVEGGGWIRGEGQS